MTPVLLGLCLALAGCGDHPLTPEPYYTVPPRQAGRPVPPITRPMIAICSDDRTDTAALVQAMIQAVCADPVVVRKDITGDCTLRLPVRTTYFCSRVDTKKLVIETPVRSFASVPKFRPGSNEGAGNESAPPPPIEPQLLVPGPNMFPPEFQP